MLFRNSVNLLKRTCNNCIQQQRFVTRKRFYKSTGVIQSDNTWGVMLDHRRIKTPNGNIFSVNSEPLARAIAAEWDAQSEVISLSSMHLTALCNTAIDNPGKLTKYDIVNYILDYMPTDTLLFQTDEEEDLKEMQAQKWGPVLDWIQQRFAVSLKVSTGLESVPLATETRGAFAKYLLSFDFPSINAINFGMEALKSPLLMIACVERRLDARDAVFLARLEEEFQLLQWGRVTWAHEMNQAELTSRVAAALLVITASTDTHSYKTKTPKQDLGSQ